MFLVEIPKNLQRALRVTFQNYGVAAIAALILLIFIPWWLALCSLYVGGLIFVCSVLAPFVEDFRTKARVSVKGKAVIISGCDSGFGHGLAQRLDDLGLQVFAGCLFPEKDGAKSLRTSCSGRLHILPLDVTSDKSVENAVKYVSENIGDNKLLAVVNNAGLNKGGEIAWTSLDLIKQIFEVNTFGVMRLTKAFLPLLCKDKGRVVTVASTAGRYTFPGIVAYSMTKHAAVSFNEGLRLEMYRFGVKVVSIEPFMYETPIIDKTTVFNYRKEAWEAIPQEIKDMYPHNYFETYMEHQDTRANTFRRTTSNKPQQVVNCLEEAVLALDPKYVYSPGTFLARFTFWFLRRLPKPIADAIIHDDHLPPLH